MSENKELKQEKLENVVGGTDQYSFYNEESVTFRYSLNERISMQRSDLELVHGTITDRGIYKQSTNNYYACYYVDLDNVLGDGWFYDDNGIEFTHRISSPDKKGL